MTHSLRSFTRFLIRALGLLLLSASLLTLAQSPTIAGCLRQAQLPVLKQLPLAVYTSLLLFYFLFH